jgi:hypothetical protein
MVRRTQKRFRVGNKYSFSLATGEHISCQLRQTEQSAKKPKLFSWLYMSEEIFGELQSV